MQHLYMNPGKFETLEVKAKSSACRLLPRPLQHHMIHVSVGMHGTNLGVI